MLQISVRLFGSLRQAGKAGAVELHFPGPVTIDEVRAALVAQGGLSPEAVRSAAIANDDELLPRSARLEASCTVSALPPVCGG